MGLRWQWRSGKGWLTAVIVLAAVGSAAWLRPAAAGAGAPAEPPPASGIRVYDICGLARGDQWAPAALGVGDHVLAGTPRDDDVSGIAVAPGYRALVYAGVGDRQPLATLTSSKDLCGTRLNDTISRITVQRVTGPGGTSGTVSRVAPNVQRIASTRGTATVTTAAPAGLDPSWLGARYRVSVRPVDTVDALPSYVYVTHPRRDENPALAGQTLDFSEFEFTGSVTVSVTKPGSTARSVLVRPAGSATVSYDARTATATFTLTQPRKVSVEFQDGDQDARGNPTHGLAVFADAPAPAAPAGAHVFRAGSVTDVGEGKAYSDAPVHIEQGALVEGTLLLSGRANSLTGHGVLSGWRIPWIDPQGGKNDPLVRMQLMDSTVSGVTLVDSPRWTLVGWHGMAVRDVKILGWHFNNDGVGVSGSLTDSFIRACDDAAWLYTSDIEVARNVFWQLNNGAVFQLGWSSAKPKLVTNVNVHDNTVIHVGWAPNSTPNNAVIDWRNGGNGHLTGFRFTRLTVETSVSRFIGIGYSDRNRDDACRTAVTAPPMIIEDMVLTDVVISGGILSTQLPKSCDYPAALRGVPGKNYLFLKDAGAGAADLSFVRLRIGGRQVLSRTDPALDLVVAPASRIVVRFS